MYIHSFVRVKKYITISINLVFIAFPLYLSQSSLANSEDNIADLLRSRQELYQLNSRKITVILASRSCQDFERLEGKTYKNKIGFLNDLNRETFNLGLKLYDSPEEKTTFLKEQLETALLVESLYQNLHSYDCASKLPVLLSQDFILKIQMMLAEE